MKINLRNLFKKPDRMIALDVELDGMHPSRLGSRVMADAVLHDLHLVR